MTSAETELREAFAAGWWINAATPEDETDAAYLERALEADWQEFLRGKTQ